MSQRRHHRHVRRSAVLATAALAASLALVAPAERAQAAATPETDGATWLARQLTDGLVHNDQYDFDDYGLSIDAALALKAVGGDAAPAQVSAIAAALAPHIAGAAGYTEADEYAFSAPYDFVQHGYYANATAKALVFAQATGQDPATYGGVDLVANLEDRVVTTGPSKGRIADDSSYGDYANTFGQAFAAQGLAAAGAGDAGDVLGFLLQQQCSAGYFRLDFAKDQNAADQTCDGGTASGDSPADPDSTSTVVLALQDQKSDPAVSAALAEAKTWLEGRQHADGSFSGGTSTDAPNTNSTALAGQALAALGDTTAATHAAIWVRRHQVQAVAPCSDELSDEVGAIAYDDAGLAVGRKDGIVDTAQDQWRRASVQGVRVLQYASTTAGTPRLTAPTAYVAARHAVRLKATGITPGTWVCASIGTLHAAGSVGLAGTTGLTVKAPAGTGTRSVRLIGSDGAGAVAKIKVLAAKRLRPTLASAKVRHGARQTVRVAGLAAHEPVKISYAGRVIRSGRATAKGTVAVRFAVGQKRGLRTVKVRGAFADRVGTKTFRVR